jgi:hypothetical protein
MLTRGTRGLRELLSAIPFVRRLQHVALTLDREAASREASPKGDELNSLTVRQAFRLLPRCAA